MNLRTASAYQIREIARLLGADVRRGEVLAVQHRVDELSELLASARGTERRRIGNELGAERVRLAAAIAAYQQVSPPAIRGWGGLRAAPDAIQQQLADPKLQTRLGLLFGYEGRHSSELLSLSLIEAERRRYRVGS